MIGRQQDRIEKKSHTWINLTNLIFNYEWRLDFRVTELTPMFPWFPKVFAAAYTSPSHLVRGILFEKPIEKMETRARYILKFPCSLHLPAPPSPPQLL